MKPRLALLACCLAGLPGVAFAQFKIVAPDGSVTYTDRAPVAETSKVTDMGRRAVAPTAAADATAGLPFELRQVAGRYPVTLFTAPRCSGCDAGRTHLQQRGIPFVERTITTEDDVSQLERITGGRTIPSLTIGPQGLRGFNGDEWNSYLDAAGYPRESQLPKAWKQAAPTPLRPVVAASAPPPAAPPPPAPAPAATTPPVPPASGIRF